MTNPPVLVLALDAADYLPILEDLLEDETRLNMATDSDMAMEVYDGEPIILGEPDLVAGLLRGLPDVNWVQSSWAGVTPLLNCGRSDFLLTGIKGLFGPQMAEYVFAYLLAKEIRVLERLGKQSTKSWWEEHSGSLNKKTLGVMGTGSIGKEIAKTGRHFGMDVQGFSRAGNPAEPFEKVYGGDQLAEFLRPLDYLVAVLPDTAATRHLLGDKEFAEMRNSCYLVNVGRGSLIDEAALARALSANELGGAVLDVFDSEPLPRESSLWHSPNLVVTGHVAAISRPRDIANIFVENYRKYCNGEPLNNLVDFDRGY
jgi:phosphoglycerate dehydrogenase-like enzyme